MRYIERETNTEEMTEFLDRERVRVRMKYEKMRMRK